jgi:hypothetical protein
VEVLDAQVHLNHIHPEWKTAQIDDILAAALAAMDAVAVGRAGGVRVLGL